MSENPYPDLNAALKRLQALYPPPGATRALDGRETTLVQQLQESVIAAEAAFTDSANPKILPLLRRHLADLVAANLQLLRGEAPAAADYVREFARQAAEQYFPLEPILHAYRICLKTLRAELASALLKPGDRQWFERSDAITTFLLEFFDRLSSAAAEYHVDQSRLLADVASDQRSELLSTLLGGYDESDRRVSRILRDAGYLDRRLAFCVVLAQSIDPAEMHNPARARRLADYIDRLLANIPGTRLVDIHRNKVTLVFSQLRRLSGWSRPRASLAQRVAQELAKIGTAARTGVSNDVESTSQIPAAYQQAALAFDLANVGKRVLLFAELPLQQLLQHFAGEAFSRVLPAWAQALYAADDRARGQLSKTLVAFADENMNVLRTAKRLRAHANTVYARFNKVAALTGRDPRAFHMLGELLIVIASRDRNDLGREQ
jgi:sugar diacid utilization regulator